MMPPRRGCVTCGEWFTVGEPAGRFCSDVCAKRRDEDLRLAERELAADRRPVDDGEAEAMLSRARLLACTWYAGRRRRGSFSHSGLDGWVMEFWRDATPPTLDPPADAAVSALARRVEWLTTVAADAREAARRRQAREWASAEVSRRAARVADDEATWRAALGGDV